MPEEEDDKRKQKESEASLITQIAISIIRDRAISNLYGCQMKAAKRELGLDVPPQPKDVFTEQYAEQINSALRGYGITQELPLMYAGWGELYSQFSRILILCNEFDNLEKYIENANESISELNLDTQCMNDTDYVRHIRNSTMHGRIIRQLDPNNPFESKLEFIDKSRKGTTAIIRITTPQFNKIIDILLEEVCLEYLKDIGWEP